MFVRVVYPHGLNVRAKGNLQSEVLRVLPCHEVVEVLSTNRSGTWGRIETKEWIMLEYTEEVSEDAEEVSGDAEEVSEDAETA